VPQCTANIVAIEEKRDGRPYGSAMDRVLPPMTELALWRRPVDEVFDKVTVNTDDADPRENRLRLLSRIRTTMNQVADFSLIEG
jgi:glycyl-tRNA synthetase beta subunit